VAEKLTIFISGTMRDLPTERARVAAAIREMGLEPIWAEKRGATDRSSHEECEGVGEARPGKFERARGGTIFLDSVGDLEIQLQTRLVSAVCDRIVERVGGQEPIPVNVRIIASTSKDLEAMLSAGQFQHRLFEAFNEFVISVPPLRDRKDGDDIPALAAMFLKRHSKGRYVRFSSEAVKLLRSYHYPGNVNELESAVRHALTMTSSEVISPEHLPAEIRDYKPLKRREPREEEAKDPSIILRICPLNLGPCGK